MFCFSGTLFHSPNCVLIIQSCDSSPVVLERLQKVLLANVKAMAISEFESILTSCLRTHLKTHWGEQLQCNNFFSELTRPVLKLLSWSNMISTRPHWVTRPKNFIKTDTETFFRDQNFRDRYRDFFSRPNLFETDTETFFRDQMSSRLIPKLFLRPNFLRPIPRLFLDQIFRDED